MTGKVLITGGAGFIGSNTARRFLQDGWHVGLLDNFDDFYSPEAKRQNILGLPIELFTTDIRDAAAVETAMARGWDLVIHLAAKAGVRPSIEDPRSYLDVNVTGTLNVLEAARKAGIGKLLFASSSSVYSGSQAVPSRESQPLPATRSPYAAIKLAGEHLCSNYAHLHGIQCVCLRFFTVYGPRQRPDLAIRKFASAMLAGRTISLYGDGTSRRDYTFIDDLVWGIYAAASFSGPKFSVFNLGGGNPVALTELIAALEEILGLRAKLEHLPVEPADPPETWADISAATEALGYSPRTGLREGLRQTVDWLVASRD